MNVRAATVIVGAIAFSSCLIALAFLLSGDEGSPGRQARAADPSTHTEPKPTPTGASAPAGQPVECSDDEGSFSVVGVSCEVGASVDGEYRQGARGTIVVTDAASGEALLFDCGGTAPTICTADGGLSVYLAP